MQHATSTALDSVLTEASNLVELLLAASCSEIHDIPTVQGVYLIHGKGGRIIYVGKGKNLKRRICDDHRGGDEKMSTSTFRRSISKLHGISTGKLVRAWVLENCSFSFVTIPDADLCAAVEALTVHMLRKQGCELLNS